jgi:hypothetical protein
MPWTVDRVTPEACRPRGAREHLTDALCVLGFGIIDDDRKREVEARIVELAISFNAQCALCDGPKIRDVRERLYEIEKAMSAAVVAFSALDDMSIDWLIGAPSLPPIFSFRPPWSAGRELPPAFTNDFVVSDNNGDDASRCLTRSDFLSSSIERFEALRTMAGTALNEFNEFTDRGGGPHNAVEMVRGTAKINLVEGCYFLAEEYLEPEVLTASVTTAAPLARLVRAVFEFATGEVADEPGNSLDRAIFDVVKGRKAQRELGDGAEDDLSDGIYRRVRTVLKEWKAKEGENRERLISFLRQDHTKPR